MFFPRASRYILPFSGGLFETGVFSPVSRYPTAVLKSGGTDATTTGVNGADALAERVARLQAMTEDEHYIP